MTGFNGYRLALAACLLTSAAAQGGTFAWTRVDALVPPPARSQALLLRNSTDINAIGGAALNGATTVVSGQRFNLATSRWNTGGYAPAVEALLVSGGAVAAIDVAAGAGASIMNAGPGSPPTKMNDAFVFGGARAGGLLTAELIRVQTGAGPVRVASLQAPTPAPRTRAGLAYIHNCYGINAGADFSQACVVLFGGANALGARLGDAWAGDLRNASGVRWTQLSLPGAPPSARHSHSMVASSDGQYAYVFGGDTAAGMSRDVFMLAPRGYPDAASTESTNIALGRVTTQSSTYPGGVPARAVDGNTNTIWGGNSCTHTSDQVAVQPSDPWWQVDLGSVQVLDSVTVWDRTDCCAGRIARFQVLVSSTNNLATATLCPNPFTDIIGTNVNIQLANTACATGRYLWIRVPGPARILTLCEVQIFQRNPWAWRTISGVANVAQGMPAVQSSTELCCDSGAARQGVDGIVGNAYATQPVTCTHTLTNTNNPFNQAWWMVDMGTEREIASLRIWPRLDCCTGSATLANPSTDRNTRWQISIGNSRDWNYNTRCDNVPSPLLTFVPNAQATYNAANNWGFTDTNLNISCPARGRYLIVTRPYIAGDQNILTLCELQAWGRTLSFEPSARAGAASVGYRGLMTIFGGTDALGFRLNDVRFFDMNSNTWLPEVAPLGTPPTARAFASLVIMSNGQLALHGGSSSSDALGDLWYLDTRSCVPLDTANYAVAAQVCTHGGTACNYDCTAGGVHLNNGRSLICEPGTGVWRGGRRADSRRNVVYPCRALRPSAPSILSFTAGAPGNATVSVQYSATGTDVQSLLVRAVPTASWQFDLSGRADASLWALRDVLSVGSFQIASDRIRMDLTPASFGVTGTLADCTANLARRNCPTIVYQGAFNTTSSEVGQVLDTDDFATEALVTLDEAVNRNNVAVGIGLYDVSDEGGAGVVEFHMGLRRTASTFDVGFESTNYFLNTTTNVTTPLIAPLWITLPRPIYSIYVRIERIPVARFSNSATFRFAYRASTREEWTYLGRTLSTDDMIGGALTRANQRIVGVIRTIAAATTAVYISDWRVLSRTCGDAGTVASVPIAAGSGLTTYNVQLSGLSSGVTYFAGAQAISASAGASFESTTVNQGFKVSFTPTPTPPVGANLREVARGRPATRSCNGALTAAAAVDGNAATCMTTCAAPSTISLMTDVGNFWQVDLGVRTDVTIVSINNVPTADRSLYIVRVGDGGAVYTGGVQDVLLPVNFQTDARCDPALAANTSAPTFNYTCGLTGRYVTIQAPPGIVSPVNTPPTSTITLSLCEVQVFAANSCPNRTTDATMTERFGSRCLGGRFGDVCAQACLEPFYTATAGSPTATCRGTDWDAPPLVCQPVCRELSGGAAAATCTRSVFTDDFNGTSATIFRRWRPQTANQPIGRNFFTANGVLTASARWGCNDEMLLVSTNNAAATEQGAFSVRVSVQTLDRAGLFFRATNEQNLYRAYIDVAAGRLTIDRVVRGVYGIVSDAPVTVTGDIMYTIEVSVVNNVFTVSLDGAVVITTADRALTVGATGLYAAQLAVFDNFAYSVPCSRSCTGATPGGICTFGCRSGLVTTGNATRTCVQTSATTADWDGNDFGCTLAPPNFQAGVRIVNENSPRNAVVGDPVVATLSVADENVVYELFPPLFYNYSAVSNASLVNGTIPLFWIDRCSGQIRVRNPVFDYETMFAQFGGVFNVSVRAFVNGDYSPIPETTRIFQIIVADVDEAPFVPEGQSFNVSEDAAPNSVFGRVAYTDPENSTVVWSVAVDGSAGNIGINATTGQLFKTPGINTLNFERNDRTIEMTVTATQPNDASLTASATVFVTVNDAPDVPTLDPATLITFTDIQATRLGVLSNNSLIGELEDNPIGRFNSTLTYRLLSATQGRTLCGISYPSAVAVPTDTGVEASNPLFNLTTAGRFLWTSLPALPMLPYNNRPRTTVNFPSGPELVRANYTVCVNVSSRFKWSLRPVGIAVIADFDNSPIITDYYMRSQLQTIDRYRMSTSANDQAFFEGRNFPVGATVQGWFHNGGWGYNATGCTVRNTTFIQCTSTGGIGSNFRWTIMLNPGFVRVESTIDLITHFNLPTVYSVVNANGTFPYNTLPLNGTGGFLVVNGLAMGLGTAAASPPGSYRSVRYGANLEYFCRPVQFNQSFIMCAAPGGAGAGMRWEVSIGGQNVTGGFPGSNFTDNVISYFPPVITRLSVPSTGSNHTLATLSTSGGQRIVIDGLHFGGASFNSVRFFYGGDDGKLLEMTGCTKVLAPVSATQVTCFTVPGAGANLKFQVLVDGQWAVNATSGNVTQGLGVSYLRPTITRISGATRNIRTEGGLVFRVEGANFGPRVFPSPLPGQPAPPLVNQVDLVTYGPLSNTVRYTGVSCRVAVDHLVIECQAAPGTGFNHSVRVVVGGQAATPDPFSANTISYAPPVITSFTGPGASGADTRGFQAVVLTGLNFGPLPAIGAINATYTLSLDNGPVDSVRFVPSSCTLTQAHTEIVCNTTEGAGDFLAWALSVDGQANAQSTTAYAPPLVTSITYIDGTPVIAANPQGNETIYLNGRFFGPARSNAANASIVQLLSYGPNGIEYEVPRSRYAVLSHSTIRVVLGPGTGAGLFFRVRVADQGNDASDATFSYAPLTVDRMSPLTAPTLTTGAPVSVTLAARNVPLNDPLTRLRVYMGSGSRTVVITPINVPQTPAAVRAATNFDGTLNITFVLPGVGIGAEVPVRLVAEPLLSGISGSSSAVTAATLFRYQDPVIQNVVVLRARFLSAANASASNRTSDIVQPCPWPENTSPSVPFRCDDARLLQLVIYGANFGAAPESVGDDGAVRTLSLLQLNDTILSTLTWSASLVRVGAWDHARIIAYVYPDQTTGQASGTINVTITSPSFAAPSTMIAQSARFSYFQESPDITALLGRVDDIPTIGLGADQPLIVEVGGLLTADDVEVLVEDTTCPLITGVNGATITDRKTWIAQNILVRPDGGQYWRLFCRIPEGQGENTVVRVVRTFGSQRDPSGTGFSIDYRKPNVTSVDVIDRGTSVRTTAGFTDGSLVDVGTNGTVMLMRGRNLGPRPVITLGDGFTLSGAAVVSCALPAEERHTCYRFVVPSGEGDGRTSLTPEYESVGFPLQLAAGNQAAARGQLRYQPAVVTSVTSSTGLFPTRGGAQLTIAGADFGSTVPGREVGQSAAGVTVTFYRAVVDRDPPPPCLNVVRVSHSVITCTLPEGSGRDLIVRVTVQGVFDPAATFSFSYDKPVVASISANTTIVASSSPTPSITATATPSATRAAVASRLPSATPSPAAASPAPSAFSASASPSMASTPAAVPSPSTTPASSSSAAPAASPTSAPSVFATSAATPSGARRRVLGGSDEFGVRAVSTSRGASAASAERHLQSTPSTAGWTVFNGPTQGGTIFTITGDNFGAYNPLAHCLCLMDSYRVVSATRTCECNDNEDFLGEGEVPAANVLAWDHDAIRVRAPEGVGLKDVIVSVRGRTGETPRFGAGSNATLRFQYDLPRIDAIVPSTGKTDGGFLVRLVGDNFGPTPYNATLLGQLPADGDFSRYRVPLSVAPQLPVALTWVQWHKSIVSSTLATSGNVPDFFLSNAARRLNAQVISHTHTEMVFRAPGGVGANRNITVRYAPSAPAYQANVWISAPRNFSYLPPLIDRAAPNPVLVDDGGSGTTHSIEILGENFGDDTSAVAEGWTDEERLVTAVIGGFTCTATNRSYSLGSEVSLTCMLSPDVRVGYRNITVFAAGQSGTVPADVPTRALLIGCTEGYFGREGETCAACPPYGALCRGYFGTAANVTRRHTYPVPLAGFYNMNSSDAFSAGTSRGGAALDVNRGMIEFCPPGQQLRDRRNNLRDVCVVACDPADSCIGDNYCATGYVSKYPYFRCGNCADGFYKRGGECIRCPDSPWALILGFLVVVIFAASVGFILNRKQVDIAVISIGVDYFQVLAIFNQSRVKWPPAVKELLHIFSAFNLNIEIVAPECFVPDVSFKQKFAAIMLLPICVGAFLALLSVGIIVYKVAQGRRKRIDRHVGAMVAAFLVLFYFLYLYETRTLLDVFNCTPTDPPDGRLYLQVLFEECGIPGGTQMTLLPWAIIGLIVYTAGYPVFLFGLLYKNRELAMEDQLLRAKGTGADRLSNPHAYDFRKRFHRAYYQFKPDYVMWIVLIVLRKFLIAATSILFNKNAAFQMAACLLVMFCAYALQLSSSPYMSPGDYENVLKAHAEACFTNAVHARLRASIANTESRGRKKAFKNLMTYEGTVDRAAVLGWLATWVFSYNTVEALMLFSAVFVCLMGIMYQSVSSSSAAYGDSRDAITSVVLAVMILTIIYFVTVVVSEIVVLYTEDQREKALLRLQERQKSGKNKKALDGAGKGGRPDSSRFSRRNDTVINTGDLTATVSPIFLNGRDGNAAQQTHTANLVLDRVTGMDAPPPPELWSLFSKAYLDMSAQLETVEAQLSGARGREATRLASVIGAAEAPEEAEDVPVKAASYIRAPATVPAPTPVEDVASKATPRGAAGRLDFAPTAAYGNAGLPARNPLRGPSARAAPGSRKALVDEE